MPLNIVFKALNRVTASASRAWRRRRRRRRRRRVLFTRRRIRWKQRLRKKRTRIIISKYRIHVSRRIHRIRVSKTKIWLWRRLLDIYIRKRKSLKVNRLNIFIDRFLNLLYRRGFFRAFNPYFSKFIKRLVNSRLAAVNIFRLSNNIFAIKGNVKILINIVRFPRILTILNLIYIFLDNLSDGLVKFKFSKRVLFLSLNIGD